VDLDLGRDRRGDLRRDVGGRRDRGRSTRATGVRAAAVLLAGRGKSATETQSAIQETQAKCASAR
jgi:hypothetical protein